MFFLFTHHMEAWDGGGRGERQIEVKIKEVEYAPFYVTLDEITSFEEVEAILRTLDL